MSFFVDGTKTGEENFYDLVTHNNPNATYLPGRVSISLPAINPQTGMTEVVVTSIPGEGYVEHEVVSYLRQPPVRASGTQGLGKVTLGAETYSQELLRSLVIGQLNLVDDDVIVKGINGKEIVFPQWSGHSPVGSGYQVLAKEHSYVYLDDELSPFVGTFENILTNEPLTLAIENTSLGGFSVLDV